MPLPTFKNWTLNWKRPLLAASIENLESFEPKGQMLASPKIDGLRCLLINGQFKSRSMKLLPNRELQAIAAWLKLQGIDGLDGELSIGEPFGKNVFAKTTSLIRRVNAPLPADVRYNVFDLFREGSPYNERLSELNAITQEYKDNPWRVVFLVEQRLFHPQKETFLRQVQAFEEECLTKGYEGIMLRSIEGLYKQNRSTLNEQTLLKLKRFQDSEALILEAFPLERNLNPSKTDELGFTTHSSHQGFKVPDSLLGGFLVRDLGTGEKFSIGTGFTQEQRERFWDSRKDLLGKVLKYKFFPKGVKEKPRHPVFLGFRELFDL